jgi:hypothetical protein
MPFTLALSPKAGRRNIIVETIEESNTMERQVVWRHLAKIGYGLMIAICVSSPALAQKRAAAFTWTCNLEGAPARLVAQVEAITPAGVYVDAAGLFAGSISTGEVNYYYQGTLDSETAHYSFTGENAYANFTDLVRNERFLVQFVLQGQVLLLIANPLGPGPTQYACQMGN